MSENKHQLHEIPGAWNWTTSSEVCSSVRDGTHDTPKYLEEGIPLITSKNLNKGKLDFSNAKYISLEDHAQISIRSGVENGDVLFAMIGTIGNPIVVETEREFSIKNIGLFKKNELIIVPKYLKHWLSSYPFEKILENRALIKGTTQKFIPLGNLRIFPIPLPPLNEQKRIVGKIEALQKRSQRVKEAIDAIPQLLDQFRQSVLAAAFRGDLTADWRENNPDVEPASVLLEKIRAERRRKWEEAELEKMKASGKTPKDDKWKKKYKDFKSIDDSELPELPEGWTWTSTENLSSFESNAICAGPFGTIFKAKDFRDSGIPIVFLRHVSPGKYLTHKPGFMDEKKWEEIFKPYSVWGGELLVTKLGEPPGICAMYPEGIGPAMVTPDVIKLSVNKDVSIPYYLMHYFNSEQSKRFAFGVAYGITRLRMNLSIFRTLPIPLAPFHEQQEVVRKIQSFFKAADIIEQQYQETKTNLDLLNQSILAKAFRGELVPQNPNDEPASILLERIRAEREKLQQQTKAAKKSKGKTTKRRSKKAPQQPEEAIQLELPGMEEEE